MAGEGDRRDERRGSADERLRGVVEDSPDDEARRVGGRAFRGGGHVSGDVEWVDSDADDPDGGSGRTDADDGGYLPGEGTGRPYR